MVPVVCRRDFAVAVAQEARHGLGRVEGEGLFEDVEGFGHCRRGLLVLVVVLVDGVLGLGGGEDEGEDAEEGYDEG